MSNLRTGFRTRNVLALPVVLPGTSDIVGVLEVLNKHAGTFNEDDLSVLTFVASLAGLVLASWCA